MWRGLAGELCDREVEPRGVVVVVGAAEGAVAREGLAVLDAQCDAVRERLGCPLLWCGTGGFLRVSGEAAPEWWELRAREIKVGAEGSAAVAALSTVRHEAAEVPRAEALVPSVESSQVRVFYSYAAEDDGLRRALEKHLTALRKRGAIADWYSGKVGLGRDRDEEIEARLRAAHVILVLVSADFLASKDAEMDRAIARHRAREARVIPILVRPCDWAVEGLAGLSPLPDNRVPVTSWKNQDEAWENVARGLRAEIERVSGDRATSAAGASVQSIAHAGHIRGLRDRLAAARKRKERLSGSGMSVDEVDREILNL